MSLSDTTIAHTELLRPTDEDDKQQQQRSDSRFVTALASWRSALVHGRGWTRAITISVVLVLVLVCAIAGYWAGHSSNQSKYEVPRCHDGTASPWERSRLMGFNYDHDLVLHESQQALDDIKLWMHVIVAAARNANSIGGGFLRTFQDPDDKFVRPVSSKPAFNDTTAIDYEYLRDCMTDDDFLRPYADPYCSYLWLQSITNRPIQRVDKVLAVITKYEEDLDIIDQTKNGQNGGVRCHYDDGSMAYFKMCWGRTASTESYLKEIVTFHIDRLMGFYRTPVVTPFYMSSKQLLEFAREHERLVPKDNDTVKSIRTVIAHCGRDTLEGVHGSLVGWAPFPVKLIQHVERREYMPFLYYMNKNSERELNELLAGPFNITRDSPPEQLKPALESITEVMFTSTIGFMRKYGHNTFAAQNRHNSSILGPLTFIDNDRAAWDRVAAEAPTENIVRCHSKVRELCKFPRSLARRFLVLGRNHSAPDTQPISLGKLLLTTTGAYGDNGFLSDNGRLFSAHEAAVIDANVQFWYEAITDCIAKHGEDNVLMPDQWLKRYDPWENLARRRRSRYDNDFSSLLDSVLYKDATAHLGVGASKLSVTTKCGAT